ncbi:MAG: glycosyltransferase family 2 protein [Solobacterium sp.]|jgi:glycosyltransferase involved in cell wall biosynthesis|nr:glycosyltransferase family 2 protein [Solobacterium sp.]
MTRVSVAMAVYNGGKYLNEQMGSIINQLTDEDEFVVSDNMSTDDSRDIILSYSKTYPNIIITECNEQGILANFENAVNHCSGDYIFLADQDDVWNANKIQRILQEFKDTKADLVLHDCTYVDENLVSLNKTLFSDRKAEPGVQRNLWKNAYQGCCMAFKKELIPLICPIPRNIAMHDQWIGLLAEETGTVAFLPEQLIQYRKHRGSNSSKHIGLFRKIHYINEMKKQMKHRINKAL